MRGTERGREARHVREVKLEAVGRPKIGDQARRGGETSYLLLATDGVTAIRTSSTTMCRTASQPIKVPGGIAAPAYEQATGERHSAAGYGVRPARPRSCGIDRGGCGSEPRAG